MVPRHRWLSVAAAMNERMAELGLDQADLAEESGLSPQVVRDLQRGTAKAYRPTTLVRVATALEWPADAFPRLLNGLPVTGDHATAPASHRRGSSPTTPAGGPSLEAQVDDLERSLAELRRELDRVRNTG